MKVVYVFSLIVNLVIVQIISPPLTEGARILCVFQTMLPSHQQTLKSISKTLSLRGHEVIAVTPVPINNPKLINLTEIDISVLPYGEIWGPKFEFLFSKEVAIHTKIGTALPLFSKLADAILGYEPFRTIYMDENQKFDLIILQTYINPTLYALSAKMKTPIIGVSSMGLWSGSHVAAGNPNPPSIYSEMYLPYNGDLSFYERIKSTLYFLWSRYYIYFVAMPRCDKIARKHLGSDLPYLADIERNVSALFLNINPILYTPRPMVPTMIPLSFMHVEPAKPLPEYIKKEIESAKNGVVYFSMGSTVRAINIPERITNLFMKAMTDLPYKVLWKYENEDLPKKPQNVFIQKWFPQQDVLAHPNVKVFVTQCGLQSFEETVDREVPIVCIPLISDQEMNSMKLARLGYIRQIDYLNTTKKELVETIIDVAENPIYRQHMKTLRQLLQDEPMTGPEKVVWWSEYVIRHKGTKHLKSPTADIEWHQYLLLDVFAVIIGGPILALLIVVKLIKSLLRCSKGNGSKKKIE